MSELSLLGLRISILVGGIALIAFVAAPLVFRQFTARTILNAPINPILVRVTRALLVCYCVAHIAFVLLAMGLHLNFPLHLNLMEGTVLQHAERAARGLPIYPAPSPDFVALAYNVGYYLLATPFAWVFGANLFTLRLVAALGGIGSGLLIYRAVSLKTASRSWGLLALGLFAAAYGVMEAYLDTAHSDSWLLGLTLLGATLIDHQESRRWHVLGLLALIASFWFKQHGALFALGGLVFLFWRDGMRAGLGYLLLVVLFGPVLYIFAGPTLFGSAYHFFTWVVPSGWSELNLTTVTRFIRFIVSNYFFLALASTGYMLWLARAHWAVWRSAWRQRLPWRDRFPQHPDLSVWHVLWVCAVLSGFMGALDPGSANNVFICMGAWFIVVGVWGLHTWLKKLGDAPTPQRLQLIGVLASLGLLLYDPRSVIPASNANIVYQDFLQTIHHLDGPVYAPDLGYISGEPALFPRAHWVALEDMVRHPGNDGRDAPETRRVLQEVLQPNGPGYLLTNVPVDQMVPALAFLSDYYVLKQDFGPHFQALEGLPGRFSHGYPRYLYRHK